MRDEPKPTILPPEVDEVRNHASTVSVLSRQILVFCEARLLSPVWLPVNRAAVSGSPMMAPAWP